MWALWLTKGENWLRKVYILCVQETRWKGSKSRNIRLRFRFRFRLSLFSPPSIQNKHVQAYTQINITS